MKDKDFSDLCSKGLSIDEIKVNNSYWVFDPHYSQLPFKAVVSGIEKVNAWGDTRIDLYLRVIELLDDIFDGFSQAGNSFAVSGNGYFSLGSTIHLCSLSFNPIRVFDRKCFFESKEDCFKIMLIRNESSLSLMQSNIKDLCNQINLLKGLIRNSKANR